MGWNYNTRNKQKQLRFTSDRPLCDILQYLVKTAIVRAGCVSFAKICDSKFPSHQSDLFAIVCDSLRYQNSGCDSFAIVKKDCDSFAIVRKHLR